MDGNEDALGGVCCRVSFWQASFSARSHTSVRQQKTLQRTGLPVLQALAQRTDASALNGDFVLSNSTVRDDGTRNQLFGCQGRDWFFASRAGDSRDQILGRRRKEVV